MDFMKCIGEAIKAAAKSVGLKQLELARRCDISQVHMSNVMNGKSMPSLPFLMLLSSHLCVDVYLLALKIFEHYSEDYTFDCDLQDVDMVFERYRRENEIDEEEIACE